MSNTDSTARFCPKCRLDTERTKRGDCKPCAKFYQRAWYLNNSEKVKSATQNWQLENPDKVKKYVTENSEKIKQKEAAYRARYPERIKAYNAKWRYANPEKYKASITLAKAKNPWPKRLSQQNRRAKKRESGGNLSKDLVGKLFKLQKGKCACCGLPLGDDYHIDHIMPLALGGAHTDANIQLLKARCNMQKNAKHPVDFMQQRGFLL